MKWNRKTSLKLLSFSIQLALLMGMNASVVANSMLSKSWGLIDKYGVDAPNAWKKIGKKCQKSNVVIAVIDTGVDFAHPDLISSRWVNSKEAHGKKGVDDDKNGFVDDIHGWDFVTKSGRIVDVHGHGTHISGIIAGKSSEKISVLSKIKNKITSKSRDWGLNGVCPGAKIMSLRYHGSNITGLQAVSYTVQGIRYAVKMGANIINYSGGGRHFSRDEYMALKEAESKGVLVIAAAGNEMKNMDLSKNHYYPAAYPLSNIISVTAIDKAGKKVLSSNWGKEKVHVAAPGKDIVSAWPGNQYSLLTGTSQATAFVSGIAALLLSDNPGLHFTQVKQVIEDSSVRMKSLLGTSKNAGRADAHKALQYSKLKYSQSNSKMAQSKVNSTEKKSKKEQRQSASSKQSKSFKNFWFQDDGGVHPALKK